MTEPLPGATTTGRLQRDALVVTVCTLLSRITGFGRVLATAAVLGSGLLGDVYQTANLVPNLLFELVALGVLQAVLVPAFAAAQRDGRDALDAAVRAATGAALVALGVVAVAGIATSPLLAQVMVAFEPAPEIAADKLDVMVPMVLVFVPQLVFYGLATVTSAALNAQGRFVAGALAPAANNVVVILACLFFRWARDGAVADLDLSEVEFSLIAGGTTAGVACLAALPWIALRRTGISARPVWRPRHPAVSSMRDNFGWATLSIVGTLVPTATALLLGNGAAGGVAIYVFVFAFFVLPHSLVAVPLATALSPRVAATWQVGECDATRESIDHAVRVAVPLLVLGGAGMVALAWPVADVMAFGQIASQGLAPIAFTFVAFGPGLLGYGLAYMLTRTLYSLGDVRAASRLVIVGAVVGVIVMQALSALVADDYRSAALAAGYGAAQTATAVLLVRRVRSLTGALRHAELGRQLLTASFAGCAAGAAMLVVAAQFGPRRRESGAAIFVAGVAGVAVFVAVLASVDGGVRRRLLRRSA
ncbi:MAG: hypothetical protein RLY45_423 [Actinomycetota bacterium]